MGGFSHYTDEGDSRMVDISGKDVTRRSARAEGFVKMGKDTLALIDKKLLPKGNVFEVARIAGIMAAKRTPELIPMCHPLLLTHIDVQVRVDTEKGGISLYAEVRLEGKTGAEMEALTAVCAAALTVYDMCKAVDKTMAIGEVRLVEKRGGKSDIRP